MNYFSSKLQLPFNKMKLSVTKKLFVTDMTFPSIDNDQTNLKRQQQKYRLEITTALTQMQRDKISG